MFRFFRRNRENLLLIFAVLIAPFYLIFLGLNGCFHLLKRCIYTFKRAGLKYMDYNTLQTAAFLCHVALYYQEDDAFGTRPKQPSKSVQLYREALAIQEKILGGEHLDVAKTLAELAEAYSQPGNTQLRQQVLLRALAIRERVLGACHLDTIESLIKVGMYCDSSGQSDTYVVTLLRALELTGDYLIAYSSVVEKNADWRYFYIFGILMVLVREFLVTGQYERAEQVLTRLIATADRLPENIPLRHPDGQWHTERIEVVDYLTLYAWVLQKQGREDERATINERVRAIEQERVERVYGN